MILLILAKTGDIRIDENALYKNETDINPDAEVLAKLKNKYYTQNKNAEQTEEEALQNADLISRMILNTANKLGMSVEDVDKVFGINIQSMSTEEAKEQLRGPVVYNQSVNKKDKYFANGNKAISNFYDIHKEIIETEPGKYTGKRTIKDVLEYLETKDKKTANIQTPIETVTINRNDVKHLLRDNEKERADNINKVIRTLQNPNLIINDKTDNVSKNYYLKIFKSGDKNKAHLQVVKHCSDGTFYVTNFNLKNGKFNTLLKHGQIIYDLSDKPDLQSATDNTSITNNKEDFNLMTDANIGQTLKADYEQRLQGGSDELPTETPFNASNQEQVQGDSASRLRARAERAR